MPALQHTLDQEGEFRLLRTIFVTDPMAYTRGARMPIVSFITGLRASERIPSHRDSERCTAKVLSTRATRPVLHRRR